MHHHLHGKTIKKQLKMTHKPRRPVPLITTVEDACQTAQQQNNTAPTARHAFVSQMSVRQTIAIQLRNNAAHT
jgi:hypothetical protein